MGIVRHSARRFRGVERVDRNPVEGVDCLAREPGDWQFAQQWADVEADHSFVTGSGGHPHVHHVEVAVHELVDGGACAGVALLVDLPDQPGTDLLGLGERA